MIRLHSVATIVAVFYANVAFATVQKTITVSLDSTWKQTPLHLEAAEFFAEENHDAFWNFIDDMQAIDTGNFSKAAPKSQYEIILDVASKRLSAAKLALLKLSLALRVHSPAVETFQQIARDKAFPGNCDIVYEVGEKERSCDIKDLDALIAGGGALPAAVYKVDHVFGSRTEGKPDIVLYADFGSVAFDKYHSELVRRAKNRQINYVLRPYVSRPAEQKVRLSGYGVELAIKSTEYKAQDDTKVKESASGTDGEDAENVDIVQGFDFKKLKERLPSDKVENLEEFKKYLKESEEKELAALKAWELQELSVQAAHRILHVPQEDALKTMRDIAQNFPSQARSLVGVRPESAMKRELEHNQKLFYQALNLETTDASLFINGLYFDVELTDVFTLLETLKQETRLLEGLHHIGVPDEAIPRLMKLDVSNQKVEYGVDIRDSAVQWINDIEEDPQYRNWPSSLNDMLRPTYPGMLRSVRKNLYNLVVIADPSDRKSGDILKLLESFYIHKAPLRVGLVFAVNPRKDVSGLQDGGVAMLNAFNFIAQDKTPYDGLSFLTDVYAISTKDVTSDDVINHFKASHPNEDLNLIFGEDSDYDTGRVLAWDFINRTGIGAPPRAILNGILLKESHLNGDNFEEGVLTEIMRQTPSIQKAIYKGELTDHSSMTVIDYLMSLPNIMPRLNQRILSNTDANFLDLTGAHVSGVSPEEFGKLSSSEMIATIANDMPYVVSKDKESYRPLTVWVVGDWDTTAGQELLSESLTHLQESDDFRLGIIHNSEKNGGIVKAVVSGLLSSMKGGEKRQFLSKLIRNAEKFIQDKMALKDMLPSGVDSSVLELSSDAVSNSLKKHSIFCAQVLRFQPGERAVLANGKIIGPLATGEEFTVDDYNLLERYSLSSYGDKIRSALKSDDAMESDSEMAMKVANVLQSNTQTKSRHDLKDFNDEHSVLKIRAPNTEEPAHEIVAIVDPVSRGAQKLAAVLIALQNVVNANLKVYFNCVMKHSVMPLKSYYRFIMDVEPQFNLEGQFGPGPMARFADIPSTPIFTLGMSTPENWLVAAVKSAYDLDNIRMADVESRVQAEFELENLLVEGHCFEQSTGNPPRGLQFTIGAPNNPVIYDTIVMANLGYFQLKANPGTWFLRIRSGRSSELYDIVNHEFTDSSPTSSEVVVLVTNFRSRVLKLRVAKKPGKEREELLVDSDDHDDDDGIWNSITSSFGSDKKAPKKEEEETDDVLNIFSVASGHLYERLLRIMMISVLKHTKTPVKFWFLKNYLSPIMKDILPYYAKEYGFQYELVEYKWPRWLNTQTEKQRIIWGYKILFLDVLFPLDVKKIIFVDADQVVRTDLKELRDFDLGGAPYGYTPFCDSRTDMEGFRFWKHGYWASHLGHRKYHISALYVVDLKKFRRIAAGDRLRGQYQGLSQDPNSLSNLDQDLPNNMIHQVAIKSLPQEWLWCETWCDDDSKKKAKTIDLCNNPKTKEPKLVAAERILPEWKGYDDEVKAMLQRYNEWKKSGKSLDEVKPVTELKGGDAGAGDSTELPPQHSADVHSEL